MLSLLASAVYGQVSLAWQVGSQHVLQYGLTFHPSAGSLCVTDIQFLLQVLLTSSNYLILFDIAN